MTDAPAIHKTPQRVAAAFVEGSIMRHVLVMTGTGLIGLMAIFVVDFLNLFYIAQLGRPELSAAIGFCGAVLFFLVSISIGLTIAVTALTARAIGGGDRDRARRLAGSGLATMAIVNVVLTAILWPYLHQVVGLLGATGAARDIAVGFLQIAILGMPIMGLGMALSGVLRAVGDARRAMYVTLIAGVALAGLDPLLIFGFHLGITGAAIATVISRVIMFAIGWYGAVNVHRMVARPTVANLVADARAVTAIALPAILTNVATPVGAAFSTAVVSQFGDKAVAGWAVVDRLVPLAFGGLFALSGSVGPILAQNMGARRYDRMRRTLTDSMLLSTLYVFTSWALLFLLQTQIIYVFNLQDDGAAIVAVFCRLFAGSFLFLGALFVANAAFNNLGFAMLSTGFNWGRATLGTIPFAYIGAHYGGAVGVGLGIGLGTVVFGIAALIVSYRVVDGLAAAGK
jgi:putative MATE family efflux protein